MRESLYFRQLRIPDEPVGPEVGDADFQGVSAEGDIIRYINLIRDLPKGTDGTAVHDNLSDILYVSKVQDEVVRQFRKCKILTVRSCPAEILDAGGFGFSVGDEFLEQGRC